MIERQSIIDNTPEQIKKWLAMPYAHIGRIFSDGALSSVFSKWKILDISSGNGVNQHLLGCDVWSVDYHDNTVPKLANYTRIDLNDPNLTLPFKDEEFDLVISFETIEHLNQGNHKRFIEELLRVSRAGIMCGTVATDGVDFLDDVEIFKASRGNNEFHLKEYSCEEFKEFFEKNFCDNTPRFSYGHYPSYEILPEFPNVDFRKSGVISIYTTLIKQEKI